MTYIQCEYKEMCKFYEHESLCCIYPIVSQFCRYKRHYDKIGDIKIDKLRQSLNGLENTFKDFDKVKYNLK